MYKISVILPSLNVESYIKCDSFEIFDKKIVVVYNLDKLDNDD